MRLAPAILLSALLPPLALPAAADEIEVDLELVLLVDVSRSMTVRELEIQRQGYAAALDSDAVHTAIQSGLLQRVAMAYVEWAGTQEIIVDWRVVETREDLANFADTLSTEFHGGLRRTSISEALVFATGMLNSNEFSGLRRVIDISGDGPNNEGRPVERARDAAVDQGIVINGLPLMTREGTGGQWQLEDLDLYYEACVTGGPGSFVIPVLQWGDFVEAVRKKLVLEMVSRPLPEGVIPAQFAQREPYDCMVGEKMWQRRQFWDGGP